MLAKLLCQVNDTRHMSDVPILIEMASGSQLFIRGGLRLPGL